MKKKAIIVDIDGTVADRTDRGIHEYHRVLEDTKHEAVIDLILAYSTARPDVYILFVSGRPDSCYDDTWQWLQNHNLPAHDLFMRTTGDYRKDYIVKKEIYERDIKPRYDILFVLDDRTQVVQMWRAEGLVCLQVAPGDF